MALGKAVPLLVIAAAALAFAGKKRNGAEGLTLTGETGDGEPPPDDGLPRGKITVDSREDPFDLFLDSYKGAVDNCVAERGSIDVLDTKVCTLNEIFPDATWPPPPNAMSWQIIIWEHPGFNNYAEYVTP